MLENKYLEVMMQDDKYVVRCEQLRLITESDNGVIFHKLQHQKLSSSCFQNRGVHVTQLLAELGQF